MDQLHIQALNSQVIPYIQSFTFNEGFRNQKIRAKTYDVHHCNNTPYLRTGVKFSGNHNFIGNDQLKNE